MSATNWNTYKQEKAELPKAEDVIKDGPVPVRPMDAKCGDLFVPSHLPGADNIIVRKPMKVDNTFCTVDPSGIKKVGPRLYMAVCHHHND